MTALQSLFALGASFLQSTGAFGRPLTPPTKWQRRKTIESEEPYDYVLKLENDKLTVQQSVLYFSPEIDINR